MAHKVTFDIKDNVLEPQHCIIFDVQSNGKKFGTLEIYNTGISWFPRNAKKTAQLSWKQFNRLMAKED